MTFKRYAFTSAACAAALLASNLSSSVPRVVPYDFEPPVLPKVLGGPPTLGGLELDACAGGAELSVRPGWEKASLSEEVEQRLPIAIALSKDEVEMC